VAEVLGVSCGPVSRVYRLSSSTSELKSVSNVVACDTRFEERLDKAPIAEEEGRGVRSSSKMEESLVERGEEERDIERCEAVSPSSSD
jgi:hypothetical protein